MYKIGIIGKANSGKSTLSDIFAKQIELYLNKKINTQTLAFADPMKTITEIIFPNIPKEYLYGASYLRNEIIPYAQKNNNPLTIRQFLQDLGTDFARNYNKDIWINIFDHTLRQTINMNKYYQKYTDLFICSDCRFINEFEYLKDNNFNLIKLVRDQQQNMSHSSETEQEEIKDNQFNFIIQNNETLQDLTDKIIEIIPKLKH